MSTTTDSPLLQLRLEISPDLTGLVSLPDLESSLRQMVTSLLENLNIPGIPALQVEQSALANPISLQVENQSCPIPRELLAQIFHYVRGSLLDDQVENGIDLNQLKLARQVESFICLACQGAILLQPAILFTPAAAEAYRQALIPQWSGENIPGVELLRDCLDELFEMRISAGNLSAVSCSLQKFISSNTSFPEASEAIITEQRPHELILELPEPLLRRLTLGMAEGDKNLFELMRDGLFYELGIIFPELKIKLVENLHPDGFRLWVNNLPTIPQLIIPEGLLLVNATPDRLLQSGIKSFPAVNPANYNRGALIVASDANPDMIQNAGLTTWNPLGYLILCLSSHLRSLAYCFLDNDQVDKSLNKLQPVFPDLIAVVRERASLYQITRLLRYLLHEEISIRDTSLILHAMLNFETIEADALASIVFDERYPTSGKPTSAWLEDPANLAGYVRSQMKPYLSYKYTRGENALHVYLLDQEIERLLNLDGKSSVRARLAGLTAREREDILQAIRAEYNTLPQKDSHPAILTTNEVRPVLMTLVKAEFPRLPVLSYSELTLNLNIEPVGRISLDRS